MLRAFGGARQWLERRLAQVSRQTSRHSPQASRHTAWTIADPASVLRIQQEYDRVPFLYIADGHHRSAAAARVYLKRKELNPPSRSDRDHSFPSAGSEADGEGDSGFFLAVIFPRNQLQILPYHRVLQDLNGMPPARLLEKLGGVCIIQRAGSGRPTRKHELGLYLEGHWHTLHFRPKFAATTDPIEQLDVTLLQRYVFDPIFGGSRPAHRRTRLRRLCRRPMRRSSMRLDRNSQPRPRAK